MDQASVSRSLLQLHGWLETMRSHEGYGGPVTHWWQNCLQFAGPGLDWRYEGIIIGYLNLHRSTGHGAWLERARRAADDLLRGQLPSGNYRNSSFELNPYTGGTPHEAACDLALLHLAKVLRDRGDAIWTAYAHAAERNIRDYYIAHLWDGEAHAFRDHPRIPSFVPNKAATLVEALCALSELSADGLWIEGYALPTLEAVLAHQVRGGLLDGAIAQYSQKDEMVHKFFPLYIARCVPGLVAGYKHTHDERWIDAALRAMGFVLRWQYDDGSFPQVVYVSGRVNRYPQWVAGVGDILRAMALLEPHGLQADREASEAWLLQGLEPQGAVRTAHGFVSQLSQRDPGAVPEFRDLLPVVGWSDKAFRYLAEVSVGHERGSLTAEDVQAPAGWEAPCQFREWPCRYREDGEAIELWHGTELSYRWHRGARWAEACPPDVFWK